MGYLIDYERIKNELSQARAKRVLVQLPDGLKKDYKIIEEKLAGDYELYFWLALAGPAISLLPRIMVLISWFI